MAATPTVKPCLKALLAATELEKYEDKLAELGYIFAKDIDGVDIQELINDVGIY